VDLAARKTVLIISSKEQSYKYIHTFNFEKIR